MSDDRIIVTMTSWKSRIGNVATIVRGMKSQSLPPWKIVINLSVEEFPGQDSELPSDLITEVGDMVEINWLYGPNRKQWKKIIPTMMKYPNDILVCCDDDFIYPGNFIEALYDVFVKNPGHPVTINAGHRVRGMLQHCGAGTMEKLEHYGDEVIYQYLNNPTIFRFASSDSFYTYLCNRAGHPLIRCTSITDASLRPFNAVDGLSSRVGGTASVSAQEEMMKYLDSIYGKN